MRLYATGLLLMAAAVSTTGCAKKKKSSTDTTSGSVASAGGGTTSSTTKVTSVDAATVTASNASLKTPPTLNLINISGGGASLALTASPGGDYAADQGNFHVDDQTFKKLQNIGGILCFLSQTGFNDDHVVNAGQYLAQVDMAKCFPDQGSTQGGSKQVMLINVTVDSTRATNAALNAKLWFDMKGNFDGSTDHMAISIAVAEGSSTSNPLGIFRMTFHQDSTMTDGTVAKGTGKGQIETKRDASGNVILSYIEDDSSSYGAQANKEQDQVSVKLNIDSTGKMIGGAASIVASSSGTDQQGTFNDSSSYKMAWNEGSDGYFYVHDAVKGADVCRSESNFDVNVWQYGVYDATTGNHIKMKGGFPFTFAQADGTTGHGWASYYGLWANNQTLAAGTTVTQDGNGDTGTKGATYTVVSGPGRLIKHVKTAIALDALDGIEIDTGDSSGQKRVVYNKAAGVFQLTGTMSNNGGGGGGGSGPQWTDVTPPTTYTFSSSGNHGGFSQGLGGRVDIVLGASGTPTGAAIFTDLDVTGSAGSIALTCFQQCLKGNITADMVKGNTQYNAADPNNPWQPYTYDTALTYTFDQANHVINDPAGHPVVLASGASTNGNQLSIYALVDAATVTAMKAASAQPWDAGSQTVSYSWNVGDPSNPWTEYQALVDSTGAVVAFDAPILIAYTHSQANDITGAAGLASYGKTYHLQFDGSNLMLPGHQDSDTGFYVNDFALKAGATSDDGAYVFKPLNGSEYMKSVAATSCTGAGLDYTQAPAAPDLTSYDATKENDDAAPATSALKTLIMGGVYQQ